MMKKNEEDENSDSEEGFYTQSKPAKQEIVKSEKKDANTLNAAKPKESDQQSDSRLKSTKTKKIKKKSTLKTKTRSKKDQEFLKEAEIKAETIIDEMAKRFKKDSESFRLGRTACQKFLYLDTLSTKLRNVYIGEKFLELNGLQLIELWLQKIQDLQGHEVQPSLHIRKCLFNIILHLDIQTEQLSKAQELHQSIRKNLKSQVPEIRELSRQILKKWKQRDMNDRIED